MGDDPRRGIPPVNAIATLIAAVAGDALASGFASSIAATIQADLRVALAEHRALEIDRWLDSRIKVSLRPVVSPRLTRVLNATGIVIHTNLGRAAVSDRTARAMADAAAAPVPLELDPATGARGGRMDEVSDLLRLLTGAERALIVNNNAAAVLLVLAAVASGTRVAVSRAEAVEIGGGFRVPDVLAQSGATLVDVGTTNRTYVRDFVESGARVWLRVHPSNFAVSGFVASPSMTELREAADASGALMIEDIGSGTLLPTERYGVAAEPLVQASVAAGGDLVMFSGDKLLGGPQAGIIVGRTDLVARVERHPLARAVRADKATLAGVAETLRHYLRGDAEKEVPVWRSIGATVADLDARARVVRSALPSTDGVDVVATVNRIGGGALPGQELPGLALRIASADSGRASRIARDLRLSPTTPVYGRVENDALLVELRTVMSEHDGLLTEALKGLLSDEAESV